MKNSKTFITIVLFYVSFLNIFVFKLTPDLLFLVSLVFVVIYVRSKTSLFIRDWLPFIALFVLYEFLRGFADDFSPFKEATLSSVYFLEKRIFGVLPTFYFQQNLPTSPLILNFLLFFYSLFFFYSFFAGFILWFRSREIFLIYRKRFLCLSFFGLLFFFLIPTAPPWYLNESFNLGLTRLIHGETMLSSFTYLSIYKYFTYGNAVAAFPSLHTAWPAFTSFFLVKHYPQKKLLYITFLIPIFIGISVVVSAEHYVLDVLFGLLLGAFFAHI